MSAGGRNRDVIGAKARRAIDEKIADRRLRSFAVGESERRRVVLLELDVPTPKLKLEGQRRIGDRTLPIKKLELSARDRRKAESAIAEVLETLEDLGAEARLLRSSNVVLAKLDVSQLREVAESPHVRAIHPNSRRRLRLRAGK